MQTFSKVIFFVFINIFLVYVIKTINPIQTKLKIGFNEIQNGNFEMIILGQSHSEAGYNPFILSKMLNINTYNLGSSSIPMPNIYYLLKEANKNSGLKYVIFDLDTDLFSDIKFDIGGTYIFHDLTGKAKFEYFLKYYDLLPVFELARKYTINSTALKKIPDNLKKIFNGEKVDSNILKEHYTYPYNYKGRGFIYGVKPKMNWKSNPSHFIKESVSKENISTFKNIIKYCKNNNIKLILTLHHSSPFTIKYRNSDEIHNFFLAQANKYNVPFYDMNYVKKEYLNPNKNDFIDQGGHMMGKTADKQSEVLAKILTSKNPDKFFYKSYDEVLENLNLEGEKE